MVSSFQNTLKKETNLNMYTGVCQNRHILFFLHKALTFSSQGFLFSKVFVICCAAKGLPDSNNPFYPKSVIRDSFLLFLMTAISKRRKLSLMTDLG